MGDRDERTRERERRKKNDFQCNLFGPGKDVFQHLRIAGKADPVKEVLSFVEDASAETQDEDGFPCRVHQRLRWLSTLFRDALPHPEPGVLWIKAKDTKALHAAVASAARFAAQEAAAAQAGQGEAKQGAPPARRIEILLSDKIYNIKQQYESGGQFSYFCA
eukprot:g6068.t1